jgi:hypothetical protein
MMPLTVGRLRVPVPRDCQNANWSGYDMSHMRLAHVCFEGADLRDVDLTGTTLHACNLRGVDLRGADLTGAVFLGVSLVHADVRGVDLHQTTIRNTMIFAVCCDAGTQWPDGVVPGACMHRPVFEAEQEKERIRADIETLASGHPPMSLIRFRQRWLELDVEELRQYRDILASIPRTWLKRTDRRRYDDRI